MRHFPSITEEEFHSGCQDFYERSVRASGTNAWLGVANLSGVLSIKKEYSTGVPRRLNERATETATDENDELIDEDDHEVRTMVIPFFGPD